MIKTPCRQHWYTVNQSWVLITHWYNPAEVGAMVTEPPLKLAIHGEFCSSVCPEKTWENLCGWQLYRWFPYHDRPTWSGLNCQFQKATVSYW